MGDFSLTSILRNRFVQVLLAAIVKSTEAVGFFPLFWLYVVEEYITH